MPRLFTGLEIPAALAAELALLRGGLSGARWIESDDYHITLRFIGDVDPATAQAMAEALEDIRRAPFEVVLEGLDVFGGQRPRAVIAKVQPSPPLIDLQGQQESLMRRLELPAEPRKFVPHVTLARLRNVHVIAAADYLGQRGFLTRRFQVSRFALFSARDSVGGGPYMKEAVYPLG